MIQIETSKPTLISLRHKLIHHQRLERPSKESLHKQIEPEQRHRDNTSQLLLLSAVGGNCGSKTVALPKHLCCHFETLAHSITTMKCTVFRLIESRTKMWIFRVLRLSIE